MSCSEKMSLNGPSELSSRPRPTTPFSGFVHSSQFPLSQIFPPLNPAPRPAARSPEQSCPSHLFLRNRFPLCPRQHLLTLQSHLRARYPPPAPPARPRNSQSFALPRNLPLLLLTPLFPRPTPAATFAPHKKSFRPRGTAKSLRRSSHRRAAARRPAPQLHETLATRAAGETVQSLQDSASPFPRSIDSPTRQHPFPAAAAASVPMTPRPFAATPRSPATMFVSRLPPLGATFYPHYDV